MLVVGHKSELIKGYFEGYDIQYLTQKKQTGIMDAIKLARETIGRDNFFLQLGDEILVNSRHREMIKRFNKNKNIVAICGTITEPNPESILKT